MNNEVQNQFEKESGKQWYIVPVSHGEVAFVSWEYQLWLEEKVKNQMPNNE